MLFFKKWEKNQRIKDIKYKRESKTASSAIKKSRVMRQGLEGIF